mmetsp:Transcript_9127/g.15085  ORF Transcript_9127/g.15085 Transcript_9127/m.15085 type:complete len:494 (+) Transcript_9127:79-1560(+)
MNVTEGEQAADELRLTVQLAMTGQILGALSCNKLDTVGNFKCAVETSFGHSGPWQVLFKDTPLAQEQLLMEVGVEQDSILQLVRVPQLLFAPTGPSASCSPINKVTEDGLTVKSESMRGDSLFGCTLLEPALTRDVAFATITFRVHESTGRGGVCGGVNGLYFGLTSAEDHDIQRGYAACGGTKTFIYRCRDGDKRIGGVWQKFNRKCMGRGGGKGSYFEGDEITLEYNRDAQTLCVSDRNGPCEQPLTQSIPTDRTLHFCVDTCSFGQGATILSSSFRTATGAALDEVAPEDRPPPVHVFATSPTLCSPINVVTEDGLTVKSNSTKGSSLFGCTVLEPALTADVAFARVTFSVHVSQSGSGCCGGVNGLYVGITPADHDIADGRAACGSATTFVYRCRDGDKRVDGRWRKFRAKRGGGGGTEGAYFEGEEITLEFDRVKRSLSVMDKDGPATEPLTTALPEGCDLYFFVDTCEPGQGCTIVTSTFERFDSQA